MSQKTKKRIVRFLLPDREFREWEKAAEAKSDGNMSSFVRSCVRQALAVTLLLVAFLVGCRRDAAHATRDPSVIGPQMFDVLAYNEWVDRWVPVGVSDNKVDADLESLKRKSLQIFTVTGRVENLKIGSGTQVILWYGGGDAELGGITTFDENMSGQDGRLVYIVNWTNFNTLKLRDDDPGSDAHNRIAITEGDR